MAPWRYRVAVPTMEAPAAVLHSGWGNQGSIDQAINWNPSGSAWPRSETCQAKGYVPEFRPCGRLLRAVAGTRCCWHRSRRRSSEIVPFAERWPVSTRPWAIRARRRTRDLVDRETHCVIILPHHGVHCASQQNSVVSRFEFWLLPLRLSASLAR